MKLFDKRQGFRGIYRCFHSVCPPVADCNTKRRLSASERRCFASPFAVYCNHTDDTFVTAWMTMCYMAVAFPCFSVVFAV